MWPVQTLMQLVALLDKTADTHWLIVLLVFRYWLWARIRSRYVAQWEKDLESFWDTAIAGTSVLAACIHRSLAVETATSDGNGFAVALWDLEKFFDTIDIVQLIPKAEALEYLVSDLRVGLMVHTAPRILRHGSFVSRITEVTRSILAGCV